MVYNVFVFFNERRVFMKKWMQGAVAGVLIGTLMTGGAVLATTGTKNIEVYDKN